LEYVQNSKDHIKSFLLQLNYNILHEVKSLV
jgi:hypothetical protein